MACLKFSGKTFVGGSQTVKFVKVLHISCPLYDLYMLSISVETESNIYYTAWGVHVQQACNNTPQ